MSEFIQQMVNGLSLGGTYALLALGLAMVFGILRLINFAHGELLTIGGFTAWIALEQGLPIWLAIVVVIVVTAIIAGLIERVAFRPLRGASVTTLLLTSFALSVLIQTLLTITFSARPKGVAVPEWLSSNVSVGSFSLSVLDMTTILVAVVSVVGLTLFLKRTPIGVAMRAAASNSQAVSLMGINVDRVIACAFVVSGVLAGVAAVLLTAQSGSVAPDSGIVPLVKAFLAVVIGGLGSLVGAALGGLLLGLVEVLLQAMLPIEVLPFRQAIVLALVIALLAIRPQGIMGGSRELLERS